MEPHEQDIPLVSDSPKTNETGQSQPTQVKPPEAPIKERHKVCTLKLPENRQSTDSNELRTSSSPSAASIDRKREGQTNRKSRDCREKRDSKTYFRYSIPGQYEAELHSAIVTGSTSGVGYETALAFAKNGARVIIAVRSEKKAYKVIQRIKDAYNEAEVCFYQLDLSSLESIKRFAETINQEFTYIKVLVNNAGVCALPKRETTEDGFEMQFGTNYLGHFALTALLLPLLKNSRQFNPRVVNVSSKTAGRRKARIRFDDLQSEKKYSPWGAYARSKLANLLFTFQLQRESDANDWGISALAAHPGFARTDLFKNGPGEGSCFERIARTIGRPFSQSAEQGAKPIVYAAMSPKAKPSEYYGPNGCCETWGNVSKASVPSAAKDANVAKQLWDISSSLTNVTWK